MNENEITEKDTKQVYLDFVNDLYSFYILVKNDIMVGIQKAIAQNKDWDSVLKQIEILPILDSSHADISETSRKSRINNLVKSKQAQFNKEVDKARERLKAKYPDGYTGKKYERLMKKIVQENYKEIGQVVGKKTKSKYKNILESENIRARSNKKVVLPDFKELIKNSPTILKGATEGGLLTKSLRERLEKTIKKTMSENKVTNRNQTINKNLYSKLKKEMVSTFENYATRPGKGYVPKNIDTIVKTESRFVLNNIRLEYTNAVNKSVKQDGYEVYKKWVQNSKGVKIPRESHEKLSNQKAIKLDEYYNLNGVSIKSPHDPSLPPGEFINCQCELKFFFRKIPKQKAKK